MSFYGTFSEKIWLLERHVCMRGTSYIKDPVPCEILHIIRSLKFEICHKLVRVCEAFGWKSMVYKPCPECGKHNHHNKLKCAKCGVCLYAHILLCYWGCGQVFIKNPFLFLETSDSILHAHNKNYSLIPFHVSNLYLVCNFWWQPCNVKLIVSEIYPIKVSMCC